MMTTELLRQIGEALYGAHFWSATLAEALDVSPRNMRRFANGTKEIPPGLAVPIRVLIAERQRLLVELAHQLD